MTVTWILERNVFSEKCFDDMVSHMEKNHIPYHVVTIIPFSHEIEGKTPDVEGLVVCYGSIGIHDLAQRMGWEPGVFHSYNTFNPSTYKVYLGDMFLNNDAIRLPLSDVSSFVKASKLDEFFIKPDGDRKEFAGEVMEVDKFDGWLKNLMDIGYLENNDFDVVVSPPKRIGVEARLVVVDNLIVAHSVYRKYQKAWMDEEVDPKMLEFAHKAIREFRPHDVYVMDVTDTDDGYKVVEYNTFNSSGLYACNVGNIIDEINRFVFLKEENRKMILGEHY